MFTKKRPVQVKAGRRQRHQRFWKQKVVLVTSHMFALITEAVCLSGKLKFLFRAWIYSLSPCLTPRLRSSDLWWFVDALVKTEVHHLGICTVKYFFLAANNTVS